MEPCIAPWSLRLPKGPWIETTLRYGTLGLTSPTNMAPAKAPWSLRLRYWQRLAVRECPPWTQGEGRCAMASAAEWRSG